MTPLPEAFRTQMRQLLGDKEAEALFASLDTKPPVSIRLNPAKKTVGEVFQQAESTQVPWCHWGYYLEKRPQFTLDPALHAGCYYVQEASSMAVEVAFRALPAKPKRMLDLCAAPGGKSTLWDTLLQDTEARLLVCNEPVRQRAQVLAENMAKWGSPHVVVTQAYPRDFSALTNFFDLIAADVPCSGEGMFRKDDGARSEWTPQNIEMCAMRQREILQDVWPALRPGGHLVYSTCTFNRAENEDNVQWICATLGAEVVPIQVPETRTSLDMDSPMGIHFYPHHIKGEGFFMALLQKKGEATDIASPITTKPSKRHTHPPLSPLRNQALLRQFLPWLKPAEHYQLWLSDDGADVFALPHAFTDDIHRLSLIPAWKTHGNYFRMGIHLAKKKGDRWIPQPELALSTALAENAFPRIDLPLDTALAYLRRETIVLPATTPRGYVLICHKGCSLGFVNNLGTRANNLYPMEWRIRKQPLPT